MGFGLPLATPPKVVTEATVINSALELHHCSSAEDHLGFGRETGWRFESSRPHTRREAFQGNMKCIQQSWQIVEERRSARSLDHAFDWGHAGLVDGRRVIAGGRDEDSTHLSPAVHPDSVGHDLRPSERPVPPFHLDKVEMAVDFDGTVNLFDDSRAMGRPE
jgi:hypothetical protein